MAESKSYNEPETPLYEWEVMDRISHDRGWMWYVISIVLGVVLIIYAVVSQNFLFAILILLFAFIIILQGIIPPKKLKVKVMGGGIVVGQAFYPWRTFRSFFIIYAPPTIQRLYVERKDSRSHISIELDGEKDPNELRDLMLAFLPENVEKDDEELFDLVRRVIKI